MKIQFDNETKKHFPKLTEYILQNSGDINPGLLSDSIQGTVLMGNTISGSLFSLSFKNQENGD